VTPDDGAERSKHIVISDNVQSEECCVDSIQKILRHTVNVMDHMS
jgi:hypothetical protein